MKFRLLVGRIHSLQLRSPGHLHRRSIHLECKSVPWQFIGGTNAGNLCMDAMGARPIPSVSVRHVGRVRIWLSLPRLVLSSPVPAQEIYNECESRCEEEADTDA
jgi:hypothetical protein